MILREYNQATASPVPKMVAVGSAGAAITGLVAILALFGVIVPDNLSNQTDNAITALFIVIAAAQAIIQFAVGYFKRDAKPLPVVDVINQVNAESMKG